ncbi:MAG: APC family permease [Novosphingobium sp.]
MSTAMSERWGEDLSRAADGKSVDGKLAGGLLGAGDITFMVIAVAAPMAVVVATMPIAFALGNGLGVPGTYALAGLAMALFAIGYVRILPHVRNAGAFYALISLGFGRIAGLAAAYVALISYLALACATLGALALFGADLVQQFTGRQPSWLIIALATVLILALLSWFRIDFTAKILAVALTAEVVMLLLLDLAILAAPRPIHLTAALSTGAVFAPGIGVAAIYAFNSCIGFEATAIYQEEARDRHITVPRATYASIALICVFYVFTAWCFTVAYGPDIVSIAQRDPGHFVTNLARAYLGRVGEVTLATLVVTSAFAAVLGLFNNAARYIFAMSRDEVLPAGLARTRTANGSPFAAGLPVLATLSMVSLLCWYFGIDPLLGLTTSLTGLGSVGLMALLALTAFAVPCFFGLRQAGFAHTVAPALGGAMLLLGTAMSVINYPLLTGSDLPIINGLLVILPVVAVVGVVQALVLRRRDPARFARIGSSRIGE